MIYFYFISLQQNLWSSLIVWFDGFETTEEIKFSLDLGEKEICDQENLRCAEDKCNRKEEIGVGTSIVDPQLV